MHTPHPLAASLPAQPLTPGVYLFKDAQGRIVYVGKAKVLRKRLASYFQRDDALPLKTKSMLKVATSLDTLCTDTEKEALLLEASLIKKHRPRYNIVLRDDKQYALFKLEKKHQFPRLTITRRVVRDGSVYFGPFTSAKVARDAWKAIHQIFPLRRCSGHVFRNRVRPCLYHHMGLCLGPCVYDVDVREYARMVERVEMLLAGRSRELIEVLEKQMHAAAEALEFEDAARLRDQVAAVRATVEQQVAVLTTEETVDVLALAQSEAGLGLALLFVRRGRLLDKKQYFWPGLTLEHGPEAVAGFLMQYYEAGRFIPSRIIIPYDINVMDADQDFSLSQEHAQVLTERRGGPVRLLPPRSTTEKKLMALAQTNAREAARQESRAGDDPETLLVAVQRALHLPAVPRRIEAVDVSHTRGEQTRVGVIVYVDGQHRKDQSKAYAFDPDALPGAPGDDYAVLHAWAARRLASGPPWPDLLLVDGGRGQLASTLSGFHKAAWTESFPLAAIAKGRVEDESAAGTTRLRRQRHSLEDMIYLPGRKNPLPLRPGSPELLFLQRVRDSVHHFAIGSHRRSRGKAVLQSELLQAPGIGPKTARLLWDHFQTWDRMLAATPEELAQVPGLGQKRAGRIAEKLAALRT
ncbi:excinuclease ABC subunit UvrC [Megalodesulfovibrio gigas]|uniref:UvrABC system protein C n=1 Tax=Megalodesulfovibrio gigas (strain ATCC 19364 / DSM 1382 / NCIMB 9332 / VKM B-1759) TaxID=1121448 RepID=T2GBL9_MEGG1|nr:excinuclease ABC subunit UvrC [Megalodesulfovibrio gigas]AGW13312.1 putative excinuclease ABC subunit C [Megalodesulfovibrio gigas DSM 1382 = ATCC 19364]